MIEFKGSVFDQTLQETITAKKIASYFLEEYPDFANDPLNKLKFIIEPSFDYGKAEGADIVMIGNFVKPIRIDLDEPHPIKDNNKIKEVTSFAINNFICVIEETSKDLKHLNFDSNKVSEKDLQKLSEKDFDIRVTTKYKNQDFETSKSDENYNQVHSLRETIYRSNRKKFRNLRWGRITQLIFLSSAKKEDFYEELSGIDKLRTNKIICSDHGFKGMMASICKQLILENYHFHKVKNGMLHIDGIYPNNIVNYVYDGSYFLQHRASGADQAKMLQIAKGPIKGWEDNVYQRMIVLRGPGGTGKTIKLLQFGWDEYRKNDASVLFLTYNRALVSTIGRTLNLMGIKKKDDERGSIKPMSHMSFFVSIMMKFSFWGEQENMLIKENKQLLEKIYIEKLHEVRSFLASGAASKYDVPKELLMYDLILVDEGQDWLEDEQYVLEKIYGYNNIIIAHGINQNIRGIETQWGKELSKHRGKNIGDKVTHGLRSALRMKQNLGLFIKEFANYTEEFKVNKSINNEYSDLDLDKSAPGGTIYIVEGNLYKNSALVNHLNSEIKIQKDVENIDILHCIPLNTPIEDIVDTAKIKIWDGVSEDGRKEEPKDINYQRFVKYQSCRGLEGWITINHFIDEYWDYEYSEGVKDSKQDTLFREITNDDAIDYANKWAFIAFTRSIDSIVITLRDTESRIGKVLKKIHEKYPDFINWYS